MSGERYSLDANILFYAIDTDAGEKHGLALELVKASVRRSCILTVQTLGETYNAITRRRPALAGDAGRLLRQTLAVMEVVSATATDFSEALRLKEQRQVQFWDAMLWATLRRNGCTTIITEDLQDRPVSEGVRYLNPFTESTGESVSAFLL